MDQQDQQQQQQQPPSQQPQRKKEGSPSRAVAGRGGRGGSSRPRSASTSPPLSPPTKRPRSGQRQSQQSQQQQQQQSSSSSSSGQGHSSRASTSSTVQLLPQHYHHPLDLPIARLPHLPLPVAIANTTDIPDIDHHLHHHRSLSSHTGGSMVASHQPSAPLASASGGASATTVIDSSTSFHAATMQKQRAAEIPPYPVVDIPALEQDPPDPKALAIYTTIISWVDDAPDLASLALVSKLVHVPAMRRLWSGMFFPSIGYFSLSAGRFLLIDSVQSRWYIIEILRNRADLARLVQSFKITEGQESIGELPILPNLRRLVIEHRGRREQNSGYHDNRLIQFLQQHPLIEELTLIGATYDESEMDPLSFVNFRKLELHYSQMPNWLAVTPTQLTHLTLMGAKGRPPPATTLDQDDTYATPDPTPFKFPDDRTLTFLSPSIGGLQYLNVSCCVDISAAGLQKVLHSVPELRNLALHFCQKIDIAAAVARRPDLRKLTHLTLNCKIRCGATITSFSAYSGENRSQAIIGLLSPEPPTAMTEPEPPRIPSYSHSVAAFDPNKLRATPMPRSTLPIPIHSENLPPGKNALDEFIV
ncbi:hypothetical protein FRC04_009969 [Tulasnella sp. 424]|nr:hypothetical protein FRC04_009969 [Tulasnella sp. 424]